MAGFKEVLDALYDLLNAQTNFKNKVARNDFSQIYNTGDSTLVIRPGGFTNTDDAFGGSYLVIWNTVVEIYEPFTTNIAEVIDILIDNRDIVIDLIQQKRFLGKGHANSIGIVVADVKQGNDLMAILADDGENVTHLMLSVLIQVTQQRSVTLEN